MPKPDNDEKLFDIMYSCRSMRRLKPDPVPEELLVQLVDAAIQGPSGTNSQNWKFIIAREPATKQRIAETWKRIAAFYEETIAAIPLRAGETAEGRARQRKAGAYMVEHMHEAPAIVFVCTRRDEEIAKMSAQPSTMMAAIRRFGVGGALKLATNGSRSTVQQGDGAAYPAVQNLLLAARALGLGAVLTTPHLFVPGEFEEIIGLPAVHTLAAIIPVGYPKGQFGPITRPDPTSTITWI